MTKTEQAGGAEASRKSSLSAKSATKTKKSAKTATGAGPAHAGGTKRKPSKSATSRKGSAPSCAKAPACHGCCATLTPSARAECDVCRQTFCSNCQFAQQGSCGGFMCKGCSPKTMSGEREPCGSKCRHCGRTDGWVCSECEDRTCERCHATPHCEICHTTFLCDYCEDDFKYEWFCRTCCRDLTVCQNCCDGHSGNGCDYDDGYGYF